MEKRRATPLAQQIRWIMLAIGLTLSGVLVGVCLAACGQVVVNRQYQDAALIQGNLRQMAVSFREQLKRMDDFTSSLSPEVLTNIQGSADVDDAFHLERVQAYFKTNTDIAGMTIYTADQRLVRLRNTYSPYTFSAYSDFDAFQLSLETQNAGVDILLRGQQGDASGEYLQLIKLLHGEDEDTLVIVDKSTGPLKNDWQELSLPRQGGLRVLNYQNDVLSTAGASLPGNVDRLMLNAMTQPSGYLENVRMNGEKQYVFYDKTVLYGCTLLYILPASYFGRVDASLLRFAILLFFIGEGLLLALLLVFRQRVLQPVAGLEKRIAYLAQDRLHYEIEDASDEGEAPARGMRNLMNVTGKLNTLTKSDISLRTLLKQAELDALQSQISPHFLYNTLETIRGQALTIGATDIERMTKALSELFRYSIVNMGSKVSLQEELKNVGNYLSIQHFRFGEKFVAIQEVDDDTLPLRVPKLLIQPLVENAFQHGLEQKVGTGSITIRAYATQHRLIVQVEDDGVGIPEEKRRQINDFLQSGKSIQLDQRNRIGLSNVNDRIKLNYGSEYGIKLYGLPGKGTLVEVDLPLQPYE